jgi:hypothetical protein
MPHEGHLQATINGLVQEGPASSRPVAERPLCAKCERLEWPDDRTVAVIPHRLKLAESDRFGSE